MEKLLNILMIPRQTGLFLGAGVSKSLGLPDIKELTNKVKENLGTDSMGLFQEGQTVEDVLNLLRNYRQLLEHGRVISGVSIETVVEYDTKIKDIIFEELSITVDSSIYQNILLWLNFINKSYSKEIFTPNYDLLIEKSLERLEMPYFSGFIGDVRPFFNSELVENTDESFMDDKLFKVWKIHGSINWRNKGKSIYLDNSKDGAKMLIYPSLEKYMASKKSPYISYFERMTKFLSKGDKNFVILGYSFSDDHINDVFISSLMKNQKLNIISFAYSEEDYKRIKELAVIHPNLSLYTKGKCIVNCTEQPFIDDKNLGDFKEFVAEIGNIIADETQGDKSE